MILESTAVTGKIESIWEILLSTLQTNGYETVSQNPYNQISAKRGTKLSSAFLEGTKKGYRELVVSIFSKVDGRNEYEVQFKYNFPDWAITLPKTKQECSQLVEDFARFTKEGIIAPSVPEKESIPPTISDGLICAKCQAQNPMDATFCRECGSELKPAAVSEPAENPPDVVICPECRTSYPLGTNFCAKCGTKL
jgi:ribosomal protein L40E